MNLYRDAIARAIRERPELELVGQAGNGSQALDAIGTEKPDVAVIDRALTGLTGEQVLHAAARDGLRTRVVLIAAQADPGEVYAALADGAAGQVLAPELQAAVAGEIRLRAPQIGIALHLSTATVKTHLQHI